MRAGNVMSQSISNHDVELVKPGKLGPHTLRAKMKITEIG